MEYKTKIGISNRHVHITKEIYEQLFDTPLEKDRNINQIGEFASTSFITIKTPTNKIENVRIVGPFRDYVQVEISATDAYYLKINPPVRKSGDLKDSETITLIGPKKEIEIKNSCIIAQRHIHVNTQDAKKLKVEDDQKVQVKIKGDRSGIIDAFIKISDNGYFEMHVDRDEANAFLLKNNDEVTIII